MRFAYKRRGGPLLDWDGRSAPYQSRAGETRSLGGLGSLDLNVPRPGAPEIVSGYESPQPGAATIHLGAEPPPAAKSFDTGLIRKASALAAGFHGVRRNNGSIFWGVIWAAAAFITPFHGVLVPLFGAAQGFGQARPKSNPAKGRTKKKARRARSWRWRYDRRGYAYVSPKSARSRVNRRKWRRLAKARKRIAARK